MHSRVFHLVTDKNEDKIDLAYELNENGFVGEVADYAVNIEEENNGYINGFDNSAEWFVESLQDRLKGFVTFSEDYGLAFTAGFKQKYFKDKYNKFLEYAKDITLDEFSSDGMLIYKIESTFESKYEFYVYYEDMYYTLDSFIREHANSHTKYYIKSIADYHC